MSDTLASQGRLSDPPAGQSTRAQVAWLVQKVITVNNRGSILRIMTSCSSSFLFLA